MPKTKHNQGAASFPNQDGATVNLEASEALWSELLPNGGAVFASPGSRSTPLLLTAHQRDDIQLFMLIDERAAGFAALGHSRGTGESAVLLCTSGSAGAHYLPAVMEAYESEVPLVILTADRPPELHHRGAPQTTEQTRLFGGHVVHQVRLQTPRVETASTSVEHFAAAGRHARRHAHHPQRHGPVHINAPFAKPFWNSVSATTHASAPEPKLDRDDRQTHLVATSNTGEFELGSVDHAMIAVVIDAARSSQRGLIFCGPHPGSDGSGEAACALAHAVTVLAQQLGWPVIADPLSAVASSEDPSILRHADSFCRLNSVNAMHPDVVIHLGQLPVSQPVNRWLAQATSTFHLGASDRAYNAPERSPVRLRGPVSQSLRALGRRLSTVGTRAPERQTTPATQASTPYLTRLQLLDAAAASCLSDASATAQCWSEATLTRRVVRAARGTLLVGNSTPIRDVDRFGGRFDSHLTVVGNRGVNGIDGTLATALGLALATRAPVTVLLGDLAFLHDLDGLQALSRYDLPVTIVRIDNGGGGIFDFLPISKHSTAFEPLFTTERPLCVRTLCQLHGIAFAEAADLQSFDLALAQGPKSSGVRVTDARVNRREDREFRDRLDRELTAAMTRALPETTSPSAATLAPVLHPGGTSP